MRFAYDKNIFDLFKINGRKLPFYVQRDSWGKFCISVDAVTLSGEHYGTAYTLDPDYTPYYGYGKGKYAEYKIIGCAGSYQWEDVPVRFVKKSEEVEVLP